MVRLPDIEPDKLTPEQKTVYDEIVSGPRGKVVGPLRVWLNSPELCSRAQALGAFCRFGTLLPPRLSELAILTAGAFWKAGFEFASHAPFAREAGLGDEAIEAIRRGEEPRLDRADELVVYRFSRELLETRAVSDATYRKAESELGPQALVELVGILGYYTLICMTINVFQVPPPEGQADPFAA